MVNASDIYGENNAKEGRISAKNALSYASSELIDNLGDLLSTPIYAYQSYPEVINNTVITKYQQFIRSEVPSNAQVVQVNTALAYNDYLWAWGSNSSGQLGINSTTGRSSPVSVYINTSVMQVVSNTSTVAALDNNGYVWTFGDNTYGGIGNATTTNVSSPISIGAYQFVTISNVTNTFSALDMFGFGWAWGYNGNGECGDNTTSNRSAPTAIAGSKNFVAIQGTLAIDTYNVCWGWGLNTSGQVGDGTTVSRSAPTAMFGSAATSNNIAIAKSTYFGLTLTSDGYCYSFGNNSNGSCGDNTTNNRSIPVSVLVAAKLVQIAVGDYHALALDENGLIWSWGYNNAGQLGNGTTSNTSSPVTINKGVIKFVQIGAKGSSSVATDVDGNVWVWGNLAIGGSASNPVSVSNFKARLKRIY